MSWYKTGTITVTNGSASVVGSGTLWVDAGVLNAGDIIISADGNLYEILSIQSNTGLTLASNYLGSTLSGQAYAIMPIGLLPSALAQQVKSVLTTANAALASAVLSTAAQGLTTGQQANARANIAALGAADVGAGRLSKSVAGGTDVTLSATEAANLIIECTGVLTGNINLIVPVTARMFFIKNSTTGAYALTVKTPSGTGVVVEQGTAAILNSDATNIVSSISSLTGNLSITGALSATGYCSALRFISLTSGLAGVLNNTLTQIASIPNVAGSGLHLVQVNIGSQGDATNYGAAALVMTDGATSRVVGQYNGANMSCDISALAIRTTQTSGFTQTVYAVITRLA